MRIEEAINAHTDWKIRLRWAISERSTVDIEDISSEETCEFGKWLEREFAVHIKSSSAYEECVRAHAKFHQEAARVAGLINSKSYSEAEQLLGQETPYSRASLEVVHTAKKLGLHALQHVHWENGV